MSDHQRSKLIQRNAVLASQMNSWGENKRDAMREASSILTKKMQSGRTDLLSEDPKKKRA